MTHIEKLQAKIAHLKAKKETLVGKKRRWCNYQISRKVIMLNRLQQLQEWGVKV